MAEAYSDETFYRTRILRRKKIVIIEEDYLLDNRQETQGENPYHKFIVYEKHPIKVDKLSSDADLISEQEIDDLDERRELARIIGLEKLPSKEVEAFDEIEGVFDELIGENEIDTVQLVKNLRRRG